MFIALVIVHVLISVLLVLVVLLQAGRGAELGAAFGGMGQATTGRAPATPLARMTTGLAVVFMLTSLTLAFIANEKPTSSSLAPSAMVPAAPATATPAPTAAPVAPAAPGQQAAPAQTPAPAMPQTPAPAKN